MLSVETPEINLVNLAGGDGSGILPLMHGALFFSRSDYTTGKMPIAANSSWERLWQCGEFEPKVPLSRAKRSFVDSAIVARAAQL